MSNRDDMKAALALTNLVSFSQSTSPQEKKTDEEAAEMTNDNKKEESTLVSNSGFLQQLSPSPREISPVFEVPPGKRKLKYSFPRKLFDVISDEKINADIIKWTLCGTGFQIVDKKRLVSEILPRYFKQSQFTSFTRKLSRWGFERVPKGHMMGTYHHKFFKRSRPTLCARMFCKGDGGGGGTTVKKKKAPTIIMSMESPLPPLNRRCTTPPVTLHCDQPDNGSMHYDGYQGEVAEVSANNSVSNSSVVSDSYANEQRLQEVNIPNIMTGAVLSHTPAILNQLPASRRESVSMDMMNGIRMDDNAVSSTITTVPTTRSDLLSLLANSSVHDHSMRQEFSHIITGHHVNPDTLQSLAPSPLMQMLLQQQYSIEQNIVQTREHITRLVQELVQIQRARKVNNARARQLLSTIISRI